MSPGILTARPSQAAHFLASLLSLGALLPTRASEHGHHHLHSYRRTSHSLALVVERPSAKEDKGLMGSLALDSEADTWFTAVGGSAASPDLPHEPWWWLVGLEGGSDAELPWGELVEKFKQKLSQSDREGLRAASSFGVSEGIGIEDPKVQTVNLGRVAFRAIPQGRCQDRTDPPKGSFLPRVLPPVAEGECVLELCKLKAKTKYRLLLYNVSDAAAVPDTAPEPAVEGHAETARHPPGPGILRIALRIVCVLAMVLAVVWQFVNHCAEFKDSNSNNNNNTNYANVRYSNVALVSNENEEGLGGFHQVGVRRQFLGILKDMLVSSTMFLPVVGPLGLLLASDIVIGSRLTQANRSREVYRDAEEYKLGKLWQLLRDILNFVLNVFIIPFNLYTMQMLWASYLNASYSRFGVDVYQDSSYSQVQNHGARWQEASGLELIGWVPGIVLSTLMLTLELQNDRTSTMLVKHKKRAEAHLNGLAKGKELWAKLSKMDSRLFGRAETEPDTLGSRLRRLLSATLFSLIPHFWMCLRHGIPLFNWPIVWVTIVYVVNIAGVSTRFLALCDRIHSSYRRNCQELATFQALSWQEDMSTAIYDPFSTRNHAVVDARKRLRENIPRIASLKLEEPEDSKVWWHLRELVFIQLKDGRILMEMMVLMSVSLAVLLGVFSLVVAQSLKEITATTVVTPIAMVVLLRFTYTSLSLARDINSMYMEHTCLLHNIVAEMNMPLRPQMPLDSHLQQERFLLQVATVIEKQPPPETVASFAVTPQLFSLVVGVLGLLTVVSFYNLAIGIRNMHLGAGPAS